MIHEELKVSDSVDSKSSGEIGSVLGRRVGVRKSLIKSQDAEPK